MGDSAAVESLAREVHEAVAPLKQRMKRRARPPGLPFDYLSPGGPYQECWDWDCFFTATALAAEFPSEAVWLRNWCLNFIHNSAADGLTPGALTAAGRDPRLHHIKPFLAQGAYLAGRFLGDFHWLRPVYPRLKKIVAYRQEHRDAAGRRTLWNEERGLAVWHDSVEAGADNNPAVLGYPQGTVIGADLNAFLYRDYQGLSRLAWEVGETGDAEEFALRADRLRDAMLAHLWSEPDATFYNLFTGDGTRIRRHAATNLYPLWAGLAPQPQGAACLRRYLLAPDKFWGPHGARSLAADDPDYNNRNIIKPHSNFQGPIWPIINYLYVQALRRYGFREQALDLAVRVATLVLADIRVTGATHENYDADTGQPLAAPGFINWNILVDNMLPEALYDLDPFAL